jgi:hypothetical protein
MEISAERGWILVWQRRAVTQRRNLWVHSEAFVLQSKCTACGFSILVRSVEELVEHEKLHRTQCSPSNAAA